MHFNWWFQVIAAEGEQKASRALKEASEVIAQSSSALQLRYLQVTICKNIQKLLILKHCFFFLDTQLHIGREELYHYFPPPNRLHNTFPQGQARKRGESWLKCSRQRVDLKKRRKEKSARFFYEMLLPILVTHSTSASDTMIQRSMNFNYLHHFYLPFLCAATMHN